jgi:histidinol-phosphate aminotransferase
MSKTMTRRQWLVRSGAVLGGAIVAGYGGMIRAVAAGEKAASRPPIRMMFNENPYGPSAVARKAMIAAFDEGNLYSRAAYNELRELIAELEGLTPEHILIGSGSREILNVAGLACGLEGGELVSPHPTFEALNNYVETIGATVHRVPLDEAMQIDLQAMRKKITPKVRLVYICNPNNPTGTVIPAPQLRAFCEEVAKETLVFVDEAYHEYVSHPEYRSMVELVREGHRVIVSRTASKIHGLAGLRVGFGIAAPKIIQHLQQRLTGTTNIIGLRAAIAGYRDREFQAFSRQKNEEAKEIVYELFRETGHRYLQSHTNFVFFHTGKPIEEFQEAMEKHGFLVGRRFPPYLEWCRLSMAKPEEMVIFAEAFRKVMS